MNAEKKTGGGRPVVRIGAAMNAMLFAAVAMLFLLPSNPRSRPEALVLIFVIFVGLWVAFYFAWMWIFIEHPAELAKKLPISSKELRRKRQEFYDSLPK